MYLISVLNFHLLEYIIYNWDQDGVFFTLKDAPPLLSNFNLPTNLCFKEKNQGNGVRVQHFPRYMWKLSCSVEIFIVETKLYLNW
jgi:hypothetical protein